MRWECEAESFQVRRQRTTSDPKTHSETRFFPKTSVLIHLGFSGNFQILGYQYVGGVLFTLKRYYTQWTLPPTPTLLGGVLITLKRHTTHTMDPTPHPPTPLGGVLITLKRHTTNNGPHPPPPTPLRVVNSVPRSSPVLTLPTAYTSFGRSKGGLKVGQ